MKRIAYPIIAVLLVFVSAFTFITSPQWKINNGYSVKFEGRYADGVFEKLKGTIIFDEQNVSTAKFDVTIDVASINTGNRLKNRHAKGESWFNTDKYPVIHFVSSSVTKEGAVYEAKGELEMHGIKKNFIIPFTFKNNGGNGVFTGNFKVNRSDFDIGVPRGDESDFTKLQVVVPVTSK
ncbi:YceI family protein [Chitinophaga sp. MM2321]|uniref:YceI family protein n=1 Tax=Chitinophaga sp. MM2321 TaxID=3137178 RepID=UPI0032D581A7